jgi:small GTP-binding protein
MEPLFTTKSSLLTRYEALRRKEYERLTALLDTLGKVDGMPAEQMDQARDALFHTDHPYLVVMVGAFNTGKSSMINALIGEPVLEVGATPTTSKIAILRHGPALQRLQAGEAETVFYPNALLEQISLVDTPGLDSVFTAHDEVTRKFLHRADMVLFVMLATQAMSATNVEYLQSLRAYGKRVIVVVNQIDTVDADEQKTIKDFVAEQCKQTLGFVPPIWLISAKQAIEARKSEPRNDELWQTSGFEQVAQYINEALGDLARVRQKLETPLQIARNVATTATALVREQQNAMAEYRRSAQNVKAQVDLAVREQQAIVRQTIEDISRTFAEAIRRGREAIHDIFQFSKILVMTFGGVTELFGLAGLVRRLGASTPTKAAFTARQVSEPLDEIPTIIEKMGPRLEGRDVKDVDDLITYTRREVEQLPGSLQRKVVGTLQVPSLYDRSQMREVRENVQTLLDKARTVEFQTIDVAVRNWLIVIGAYELIIIIAAVISALALSGSQNNNWFLFMLVIIILGFVGLGLLPLRGRLMEAAYGRRMLGIEAELEKAVNKAGEQQIAAGTRMRNDAVAPFMRLVEAQLSHTDQLKTELEGHEQGLITLEKELGSLRD